MITLNPEFVGSVDTTDIPQKRVNLETTPYARLPRMERLKVSGKADLSEEVGSDAEGGDGDSDEEGGEGGEGKKGEKKVKEKNKMRGKNKSLKRHLRKKRKNIIDPATVCLRYFTSYGLLHSTRFA